MMRWFDSIDAEQEWKSITVTQEQKDAAEKWLKMLEDGKLHSERNNYINFREIVLKNILGYTTDRLKYEEDDIEFQITDKMGIKRLCIEAKGTNSNIYKYQNYGKKDKEKPILQLWGHVGRGKRKYGICTNYNIFALLSREGGYDDRFEFNFESIRKNKDNLKKFIYVFSMNTLMDNEIIQKSRERTKLIQKKISKKFYALFHDTRMLLIKEFESNENVTKEEAIYFSQIILNRMLFIFFVADRGVLTNKTLFVDEIKKIIKAGDFSEHSHKIYECIYDLFETFDKGSKIKSISQFNGSLFRSEFPRKINFKDISVIERKSIIDTSDYESVEDVVGKKSNINPIIINMLLLDQYDFRTEVDVDILGHIFEQSLTDIEILKKDEEIDKRKDDGVYYTPEYVTEYICKNTIIPYLSKTNTTSMQELLVEYKDNPGELEEKIRAIRILDPACGSGAFLIKAVDLLLILKKTMIEEYEIKTETGRIDTPEWESETIHEIIKTNIYGVDINNESIEITKLSLFLKMVSNHRPLENLSNNIKNGNSVVWDTKIKDGFDWNQEFPDIMNDGGFDVIIGNPPYVRYQNIGEYLEHAHLPETHTLSLDSDFEFHSYTDLSGYFICHSLNILKNNGKMGLILSDGWLQSHYGEVIQKVILDNSTIQSMIHPTYNIFEDADITTVILLTDKKIENDLVSLMVAKSEYDISAHDFSKNLTMNSDKLVPGNWKLYFDNEDTVSTIEMKAMYPDICKPVIGKLTGCDEYFIVNEDIIKNYKMPKSCLEPVALKSLQGAFTSVNDHKKYFLNVNAEKGILIKDDDMKGVLEYLELGEKKLYGKTQKTVPNLYNCKKRKKWYSLNITPPAPIILGRFGAKRLKLFENIANLSYTRRYIGITPKNPKWKLPLLAYLQSSFFALQMEKGWTHGGGVLECRIGYLRKNKVPNFKLMTKNNLTRLSNAWNTYKNDLKQTSLDNVVFDVINISKNEKKEILKKLDEKVTERISKNNDLIENSDNDLNDDLE